MTMKCLVALMFLEPLRIAVGHQIQADAVFEQCFRAGQHERKPLRRIGDLLDQLVTVSNKSGLGDSDERGVALIVA